MFTPFALVWAGGKLGRAAQQLADWAHRARESLEGLLARRREAKRLRAEAAKAAAVAPPPVAPDTRCRRGPSLLSSGWCNLSPAEIEPTPVPAAPVEEKTYEVPEGQSGGAAPPIPDVAEVPIPETTDKAAAPVKPKRREARPEETKAQGRGFNRRPAAVTKRRRASGRLAAP